LYEGPITVSTSFPFFIIIIFFSFLMPISIDL